MTITSQFEIEPLILAAISALSLSGVSVNDETAVAGVTNLVGIAPAVILFSGDGQYSQGIDGALQTETQFWQLSVIVKHIKAGAETTASRAGTIMTPILAALVGVQLSADFAPLEIVERPVAKYEDGYAEFPIILKTSFDVGAGA